MYFYAVHCTQIYQFAKTVSTPARETRQQDKELQGIQFSLWQIDFKKLLFGTISNFYLRSISQTQINSDISLIHAEMEIQEDLEQSEKSSIDR